MKPGSLKSNPTLLRKLWSRRLLLDGMVPRSVGDQLVEMGFDVAYQVDIPELRSDLSILDYGISSNRTVVTSDRDFGEMISRNSWHVPCGVVYNRCGWMEFCGRLVWSMGSYYEKGGIMVFKKNTCRVSVPAERGPAARQGEMLQKHRVAFPRHLHLKG